MYLNLLFRVNIPLGQHSLTLKKNNGSSHIGMVLCSSILVS